MAIRQIKSLWFIHYLLQTKSNWSFWHFRRTENKSTYWRWKCNKLFTQSFLPTPTRFPREFNVKILSHSCSTINSNLSEPERLFTTTSQTNRVMSSNSFLSFQPPPYPRSTTKLVFCCTSLLHFPVPNYGTWTKTTPQKMRFFFANPYKIEVVTTFFIERLELPNFSHMNASKI